MKKLFGVLAAVLLVASFVAAPVAPQADAQTFIREEVEIPCGTFEQCWTVGCQRGSVPTCSGFQQCPC